MLNVVEHSNRFSKVIRFGNGGEMYKHEKEDQDIAEGCKRLIQNCIILHNYYALTRKVLNTENQDEKREILRIIRRGSPMSWQHINFLGEYNFNEKDNPDSLELNMKEIKEFQLSHFWDR